MPQPDPIAPHSAPISAYMSVHSATNLAYVRYFGKKDDATSATFKSLNSRGFTVEYTSPNGTTDEIFIEFKKPLQKREEIRPVLEDMAKEAETALGLPSSLAGPPPLRAIAKALYAQATDMYTPPTPSVPLDVFYGADIMWQLLIAAGLGATAVLNYASDAYLARNFPLFVLDLRDALGAQTINYIWRGALAAHAIEGAITLGICLYRGWYSPLNTFKWTVSSLLFGYASLSKLVNHGRDVQHGKQD